MKSLALNPGSSLKQLEPLQMAVFGFLARYRGSTLEGYTHDMKCYLAWCEERSIPPLEAIRPHLELYVRWMQERGQWSESTISRRIGTVAIFYKYCVIDELIDKNPAVAVTRPKVDVEKQNRSFLRPLQFSFLLTVAQEAGPTEHALVALLGMSGLRISEATSLNIDSLGWDQGYQTISFIGKGNKGATIGLPPPVARAVMLSIGERTEGPILLNHRGLRRNRACASRMIKGLAARAGIITDITPHSLRRTFCTTGLLNKIPIYEMSLSMRHASVNTTARYDMMSGGLDRNASYQIAASLSSMAS